MQVFDSDSRTEDANGWESLVGAVSFSTDWIQLQASARWSYLDVFLMSLQFVRVIVLTSSSPFFSMWKCKFWNTEK